MLIQTLGMHNAKFHFLELLEFCRFFQFISTLQAKLYIFILQHCPAKTYRQCV